MFSWSFLDRDGQRETERHADTDPHAHLIRGGSDAGSYGHDGESTGLFKWAKSCDEGADAACKAERDRFRKALENANKSAEGL
jgi:hypothetical protein